MIHGAHSVAMLERFDVELDFWQGRRIGVVGRCNGATAILEETRHRVVELRHF